MNANGWRNFYRFCIFMTSIFLKLTLWGELMKTKPKWNLKFSVLVGSVRLFPKYLGVWGVVGLYAHCNSNNHSIKHLTFEWCSESQLIGAATGGTQGTFPPPPEIEKNCCRKLVLFPKALFLAPTFPKVTKNSIFLLNIYAKFQNFLKISKQFVFFVQTREKLTHGLLNSFEKYAKIMHFKQFS